MKLQEKLKQQADLYTKLDRSLELQASLSKEIWNGSIRTTLWKHCGNGFFGGWSVELRNSKEVVLPKTTLAKLKTANNRLFHWVMETSVMKKALASSNLSTKEMKALRNEPRNNN
tara:strand:+ start:232 stop:576 length:345 start_codon:yes stop_codon:yes gene_type:complete